MSKIFTTDADLLRDFPSSFVNNSREIVQSAMNLFRKNPNDRNANKLRDFGIEVDHDDRSGHTGESEQAGLTNNE